jgi:hypothetical protein
MYERLLDDAMEELVALLKMEDPTYGLPEGAPKPVRHKSRAQTPLHSPLTFCDSRFLF